MKFLFNPIMKLIQFVIYILILYPIVYFSLVLISLWHWNLTEMRRFINKPFGTGGEGNKRYVYHTIWDWFFNRKHYRNNEVDNITSN